MMTTDEQLRLATVRVALEKHRAMGVDVSAWEAEFFVGIIEKLTKRLREIECGRLPVHERASHLSNGSEASG